MEENGIRIHFMRLVSRFSLARKNANEIVFPFWPKALKLTIFVWEGIFCKETKRTALEDVLDKDFLRLCYRTETNL